MKKLPPRHSLKDLSPGPSDMDGNLSHRPSHKDGNLSHRPSHKDGNLSHRPSHKDGNLSHRPSHADIKYIQVKNGEDGPEESLLIDFTF